METKVGQVDDFFSKVGAVAFKVEGEFKIGDTLHFKGHTTDVTQVVDSIQVEHVAVQSAKPGDSIGMKVKDKIRKGDIIYKVTP